MAGLLDFDRKTSLGLLMAGAQMMNTPQQQGGFGAIGNGLLGFAQGLLDQERQDREFARDEKKDARQSRLDDVDMQMKQAQIQHYQNAPVGGDPYWTTIDTPQGLMKFNARTGEALPVQMDGKPLMKSSSDVALQSALAGGKEGAKTGNSIVEIENPDGSKSKTLGSKAFSSLSQGNYIPPRPTDLSTLPKNDSLAMADSLLNGLIKTESSGNPNAVSPKGAIGLTQIMPETGRNPGYGVKPLQNNSPEENMRFGRDYLAALIQANGGDTQKALSAYNQGQGNLNKNGITNQGYVNSVLKNSGQEINLQNPITKPAVGGMQMAVKNGVPPMEAIDKGVQIAEESLDDLNRVRDAAVPIYKGQASYEKQAAIEKAKLDYEPKQVAAKKEAEMRTESQTSADLALPQVQAEAESTLGVINKLRNHAGLDKATGASGMFFNSVPGSDAYDFKNLHEQAAGKVFIQAFQSLKGAGAITDIEGKAATQAISRMNNLRQSKESYLESLGELESVVKNSLQRKQGAANGTTQQQSQPSASKNIDDLVGKYL
jgi:hypothetical protein